MKIAYIGQMADVSTENGIAKKIAMQTSMWRAAGHATRYFSLAGSSNVWRGLEPLEIELFAPPAGRSRIARSRLLARRVREWGPDVIYFRYGYHSPGLPALFRDLPTVGEINSDDQREYPLTLDRGRLLYHRLTRCRILRPIAGFVAVTRELAARMANWSRPTTVIANGISLSAFKPLEIPADATPPTLAFLGSAGSPWHGLERVAELAHTLPEFHFHVIGIDAASWTRQTGHETVPPNLRLHGQLSRREYEPLLAHATAAIASLALHKNAMEEACPLKTREYLALGLPVIAAYRDTDVPEGAEYFLRLPNDATPLGTHREQVLAFVDHWKRRRVPRDAILHLDYAGKEQRRLAFIAEIAAAHSARA